jgi:hypothetical protein
MMDKDKLTKEIKLSILEDVKNSIENYIEANNENDIGEGICWILKNSCWNVLSFTYSTYTITESDKLYSIMEDEFKNFYESLFPNEIHSHDWSHRYYYSFGVGKRNTQTRKSWFEENNEYTSYNWFKPRLDFIEEWIENVKNS